MENPDPAQGQDFDWSRLDGLSVTPSGRAGLRRLIQVFLSTTRDTLSLVRSQLAARDPAVLGQTLHRFKGGCEMVGARRMAAFAEAMETAAQAGNAEPLGALLEGLEAEFRRVAPLLEARGGA